jgi:hypothetical protein
MLQAMLLLLLQLTLTWSSVRPIRSANALRCCRLGDGSTTAQQQRARDTEHNGLMSLLMLVSLLARGRSSCLQQMHATQGNGSSWHLHNIGMHAQPCRLVCLPTVLCKCLPALLLPLLLALLFMSPQVCAVRSLQYIWSALLQDQPYFGMRLPTPPSAEVS